VSIEDALRSQYSDIHIVHGLPDVLPQQSDSCKAHSGYIGCVGGYGNQFAMFFTDLEPALAFVQAGRTSIDAAVRSLGVA
jgi:hypothetical protein